MGFDYSKRAIDDKADQDFRGGSLLQYTWRYRYWSLALWRRATRLPHNEMSCYKITHLNFMALRGLGAFGVLAKKEKPV